MSQKAQVSAASDKSIALLQDIFILHALQAGMSIDSIRKHLKVNIWRVASISKHVKTPRKQ
jgi:hypothetical protein